MLWTKVTLESCRVPTVAIVTRCLFRRCCCFLLLFFAFSYKSERTCMLLYQRCWNCFAGLFYPTEWFSAWVNKMWFRQILKPLWIFLMHSLKEATLDSKEWNNSPVGLHSSFHVWCVKLLVLKKNVRSYLHYPLCCSFYNLLRPTFSNRFMSFPCKFMLKVAYIYGPHLFLTDLNYTKNKSK